ncbi:amidohydrolase family protein [Pirellulales bacterium]|nr:amidohydrolase family protein [Pirellulales bacterium]
MSEKPASDLPGNGASCSDTDRQIYEQELCDFLPAKIFDSHIHMFDRSCLVPGFEFPPQNVFQKFAGTFTIEQCQEWIQALLPQQEFHLNSFGYPSYDSDLDASAVYSGRISDNRRYFGMALVSPRDSVEAVTRRVEDNQLIGYKPYLEFVEGKPKDEITIEDMLPAGQMQVADERGLAITLHIPRSTRMADPVNQTQMVEYCRRYSNIRIIFAHVGRAYSLNYVIGLLDAIADCPNAYIDTAMVNHEGVLEYAFHNFPRDRILFGSDAPIAFLIGKSVEINNQYAYLMGEDYEIGTSIYDAKHAVTFTNFFYEQLRGLKLAAKRAQLSASEIEDLFFNNSSRLFTEVAERNYHLSATGS